MHGGVGGGAPRGALLSQSGGVASPRDATPPVRAANNFEHRGSGAGPAPLPRRGRKSCARLSRGCRVAGRRGTPGYTPARLRRAPEYDSGPMAVEYDISWGEPNERLYD